MKKSAKRLSVVMFAMLLAVSMLLAGCGGSSDSSSEKTYTMKIGHVVAEDHPSHTTLLEFKKTVEKETNGEVQVDIVPNGALGGETQLAEMVSQGSLQGTVVGADSVSGMVQSFGLIGAPYLFDNRDNAYNALDGDFGDELASEAADHNIYVAGWGDAGFRNITNNDHEVITPDDLKGMKIRVMDNDLHMKLFQLWGANPTPIAFNELFTALQQGTVDAQENPITVFTVSKFYEVQKYMSTTQHVYTAAPFLIDKEWLESLPKDDQKIIKKAATQWVTDQRTAMEDGEKEKMQTCEDNGMVITDLTDEQRQVWIDSVQPLYDEINSTYGEDLVTLAQSYNE